MKITNLFFKAMQIISVSALTMAAGAQAQTVETAPLPTVSFLGTGCPDAESASYHWEYSTLVVDFSRMVAQKGSGISLTQSRKACSITINLKMPKGLSYSLAGYGARGYDELAELDTRNLTVSNFFQGEAAQTSLSNETVGPLSEDFWNYHLNTSTENLWSPCNEDRAQTVTAAIRVASGGDRSAQSAVTLEQLRLPIRIKLCAKMF